MIEPVTQTFEATTHSAISVVNAIPAGKGVTIGINIPCIVRASIQAEKGNKNIIVESETDDPHNLIETSARYALSHLKAGIKPSTLKISVRSKIPTAVGLKSSSAVSVATVKAVFGLFARANDYKGILKASCTASKDSRASLTGAYDDAAASLLGGLAFTNNTRFKLVKHSKVPRDLGSKVAILIPNDRRKLTSSINAASYSSYHDESLKAFDYAIDGEFASAMILNSIIQCAVLRYSFEPVSAALTEGASVAGITGKGPAVAAICGDSRTLKRIRTRWSKEKNSHVIVTDIFQPEVAVQN